MDFNKLFAGLEVKSEDFSSQREAAKALGEFIAYKPKFAIGDKIERTKCGENRYKFPSSNQSAIVYKIITEDFSDNEMDMIIAVAIAKDHFSFYEVYSGFYQKVTEKKNIFSFKKK